MSAGSEQWIGAWIELNQAGRLLDRRGLEALPAPGNAPWVLTVGAGNHQGTLKRTDDVVASYSSRGPTAIAAPAASGWQSASMAVARAPPRGRGCP